MSILKYKIGSTTTLLDTGLNSLANNSLAVSAAYDNTQGQAGDGDSLADLELVATFGTAPTAGAVSVWFLGAIDDTNYEDGGASLTPARPADAVFYVRAVTTAQRQTQRVTLPPGKLKLLLKNDGTSQSFAASGNTLKLRPITTEAV